MSESIALFSLTKMLHKQQQIIEMMILQSSFTLAIDQSYGTFMVFGSAFPFPTPIDKSRSISGISLLQNHVLKMHPILLCIGQCASGAVSKQVVRMNGDKRLTMVGGPYLKTLS